MQFGNLPPTAVSNEEIDIDPTEIDNSRYIAAPVVGDLKSTVAKFNEYLAVYPYKAGPTWLGAIQADATKNNARFSDAETADTVPMTHYNALGAIKKVADANHDVYIANEGAKVLDDCRDIIDMYLPRHRLDCSTWGVMGVGLPYAIGAAEVEKCVAAGVTSGKPIMVCCEPSIHSGKESGHITYLNPQPVTGPLAGNEQEALAEHRENGKLVD